MSEKRNFTFAGLADKTAAMLYLFNSEWLFTGGKSSLLVKND
jgi:hypothetical protein